VPCNSYCRDKYNSKLLSYYFYYLILLSYYPTFALLKLHQADAEPDEADIGEGVRALIALRIREYPDEERNVLAEISIMSQYSTKKRSTAHVKTLDTIAQLRFYVLITNIYNKLMYSKDSTAKAHRKFYRN
jgi:hypothetical protein